MKKYIIKNSKTAKKSFAHYVIHDKPLYVLEKITNNVDVEFVVKKLSSVMPQSLVSNIENMYVGNFKEFSKEDRNFNAMYKDGTIYISSEQDSEEDMIDDIVHEVAHSLEKENEDLLYGDSALEREFLAKRHALYSILPDEKRGDTAPFLNPEYDAEFDQYLYTTLGYDFLRNMSHHIYYSPYAITALKEYWANGFEKYLLGDKKKLKQLSPILYNKIKTLINVKEENNNEI